MAVLLAEVRYVEVWLTEAVLLVCLCECAVYAPGWWWWWCCRGRRASVGGDVLRQMQVVCV